MTPSDLAAWRKHMRLSQRAAAGALGISLTTYQQMESGISRQTGAWVEPDRRTALACAALAAGLSEWDPGDVRAHDAGDMSGQEVTLSPEGRAQQSGSAARGTNNKDDTDGTN